MNYEIDFLPVGEESKGGDAICFRYWDSYTPQFVGVIDGGTSDAGARLVKHIKEFYHTTKVDVVINTHPHADHTAGLWEVLQQLEVKLLMMHKPWEHAVQIQHLFHDGRITPNSIKERVRLALQGAHDLYDLANRKGIPVAEPFSDGLSPSPYLKILSPSVSFYQQLLLDFTATPEATETKGFFESVSTRVQSAIQWFTERWDTEALVDPVEGTNAENNSSVVTLLHFDNERCLLTGDGGVPALEHACEMAERSGIPLRSFRLVQIPHHGSKRNVGPTILNRLVGPPVVTSGNGYTAVGSVPRKGDPKHPSRRVTNAFTRRGAGVVLTQGRILCHRGAATPNRLGWVESPIVPFTHEVEGDERH